MPFIRFTGLGEPKLGQGLQKPDLVWCTGGRAAAAPADSVPSSAGLAESVPTARDVQFEFPISARTDAVEK